MTMARSAAERAANYRSRRQCGLDAVLLDIDRELVLASGLMSASDCDNPVERRGTRRASTSGPEEVPGHQARSAALASRLAAGLSSASVNRDREAAVGPLCAQKRTFVDALSMSAMCH